VEVLFVHQNYPAQFGHVAHHLAHRHGFRFTLVTQRPPGRAGNVERIRYHGRGGATRATHYCSRTFENATRRSRPGRAGNVERIRYHGRGGATRATHYCSRTFENATWHTDAVYQALRARPDVRPDLVVGHSGFGSTLFLRELYPDVPVVNYFEYFYRVIGSDMDFRPDFPSAGLSRLRARARNAMILSDLDNCDVGYSPTHWQRDLLPAEYRDKIRVIHDGIDTTCGSRGRWRTGRSPGGRSRPGRRR
jgi:hypothetical protein